MQLGNVFAPQVGGHGRSHSVAAQDLVFLQVDVDRVRPVSRQVREQPLLDAVLLHGEAEHLRRLATRSVIPVPAIEELAVDGPLAVQAVKLERAHDPGLDLSAGQLVVSGLRRRIHAVVPHVGTGYLELQDEVALSGIQDRVGVLSAIRGSHGDTKLGALRVGAVLREELTVYRDRSLTVDLVQAVLEVNRLAGKLGEVDDHVDPFGWADAHTLDLNGIRQKIAVGSNQPVRNGCAQVLQIREEELIEARRAGIEQAEAVTARRYLEERLDFAIHQEFIAQDAVQVEQVKH